MATWLEISRSCWLGLIDDDGGSCGRPRWGFIGEIEGIVGHEVRVEIVRGESKTLAGRGVGAPGGIQSLVLVVGWTIAFAAEEAVFKAVLMSDVGASTGFELCELVCAVGI